MPLFTRSLYRAGLMGSVALALSLVPVNARAQQTSAQDPPSSQVAVSGEQNADANLNSDDADRMDQFLDDHKDIDKDLKKNPFLVTNKKYLDHHKELRSFLEEHPRTQGEFARNPNYFTQRQDRLAAGRTRAGENVPSNTPQDADRDRYGNGQNPGLRTGEVAKLDQFLDQHQQIDRDLTVNPSLANNNTYLDQHQDLRTFLNDHPDLREQFAKNANFFMQRENQFDARGARTTQDRDQDRDRNFTDRDQDRDRYGSNRQNPNPDLRNWELARMDQFLDDHQAIEKDLTAHPSLINDQRYLAQHQDLRLFLSQHPQVREEFTENPTYFMNRENRFETREDFQSRTGQNAGQTNGNANPDRDRNFTDRDQNRDRYANDRNPNPDLRNWGLARMDQFLDDHQQINQQLTANPSLINDQRYLAQHQDLRFFLSQHPQVREEFAENPTYFMNRENRFESSVMDRDQDRAHYGNGQNTQNEYAANNNPDRDQDRDQNFADRDRYQDQDRDQMNQFLGDHKDIDKDLRKNPSLVNDQKYLGRHKDLRSFFNEHPQARQEFAENASYFRGREERFDARERVDANRNYSGSNSNAVPNLTDKQAAQMDRFLDKHKDVDRDLSANPSLCKNDKYLQQHKDLRAFLNKNSEVRARLVAANSSYFAQRHERMEEHGIPVNRAKKPVKPAPAKTPIEQHETTTPAGPSH